MRPREDDFLSESDLSGSSVEGSVRRAPVDRPFTDRDEGTPRSRVARGGSGSRGGTDSSDLSASSDDDDEEQDEEKLIGSAAGSGKASAKTTKAKPVRHGTKKAKKSRRMWEMRSGDGAAAPAAQSVSSRSLRKLTCHGADSRRIHSPATQVSSLALSSSSCSLRLARAGMLRDLREAEGIKLIDLLSI